MFTASPAPNFARTNSLGGGASGNGFGPSLSSNNFGAIPASAHAIPRASLVQPVVDGQVLMSNPNHFGTSQHVVPKPDPTLIARLKPVAADEAERRDRKTKMSTVDDGF